MEEKKFNYKIIIILVVILLIISFIIFFVFSKKNWCEKDDEWNTNKLSLDKIFIKSGVGHIENESVCFVISEDKSERYAFTKDGKKIYQFFTSETNGKKSYGYQLIN